jgi:hypothetical protein
MRNKHAINCHYCGTECKPGTADIWRSKHGRWYGCCDKCGETNEKQIAGRAKHAKKAQEKTKKATVQPTQAQILAKMTKAELIEAIVGKM